MEFITLTAANYNSKGNKTEFHLLVSGITAVYKKDNEMCTIVKHVSHNNGGYEVSESVENILKRVQVKTI